VTDGSGATQAGDIFFAAHVVAASEPKAISIFGKSAAFGVRSQNLACDHKLVGSGG
jgi:hypothetical protein